MVWRTCFIVGNGHPLILYGNWVILFRVSIRMKVLYSTFVSQSLEGPEMGINYQGMGCWAWIQIRCNTLGIVLDAIAIHSWDWKFKK